MSLNSKLFLLILSGSLVIGLCQKSQAQTSMVTLDNGIQLVITPMPEANSIGMESCFEVGFIDEPQGMVQSAHLVEHLVCFGAGAGFQQKKAFEWLNQVGMANAETMVDWTHYDYSVPPDQLEKIFEIEASRIQLTKFDRNLMRAESQRVYKETDAVESVPASGMIKHAFMAISHALKFNSETALVRGGLEDFDPEKLLDFYARYYQPRNLTLVISGKVTVDEVTRVAKKHLEPIQSRNERFETRLDWSKIPKRMDTQWDATQSNVCLMWKAPTEKVDQIALSLISTAAWQGILGDKNLKQSFHINIASSIQWPVGDIPLFAYGSLKDPSKGDDAIKLLEEAFVSNMKKAAKRGKGLVPMIAFQINAERPVNWKMMEQQSKFLVRRGQSDKKAMETIVLQDALNRLTAIRFLGTDGKKIVDELKKYSNEDFEKLVEKTLNPENRREIHVSPKPKP